MDKIMELKMDNENWLIEGELNTEDLFCSHDTIFIKVNGKQEFSFGKMNQMEMFNLLLSEYLSDKKEEGVEFIFVHQSIMNYKEELQTYSYEYNGENVPDVFVNKYGGELELVGITADGSRYYENNDEALFVVTDKNGEKITDNLAYYQQHLENEKDFIYLADRVKAKLEDNDD